MDKLASIIKPVVTEKSTLQQIHGKYEFEVLIKADKITIKRAFEEIYGVKVTGVRTFIVPKKTRLIGKGTVFAKRKTTKRAIITVEKDKKIDINKIK